jgi:tetratricopeptide (TPR) repeat protein
MNDLAIAVLSALLATGSPVAEKWRAAAALVEAEYQQLLEADDRALADVERWMREDRKFQAAGGGREAAELSDKIATRLLGVVGLYEDFLRRHPRHVEGRIAFGSFLNEVSEEERAAEEWEKARQLDPTNPAPWNNLANHYGHFGSVTNAFAYYAKAIELRPEEPIYYQNLATTVYLFRRDAEAFYGIDEQAVFDKALGLYRHALKLSPGDFAAASDLAQTYYGITPFRLADAQAAWEDALKLAKSEVEKQGVYIHFARLQIRAGNYEAATNHLEQVSLPQYEVLKTRLFRSLEQRRADETGPAPAPAAPELP